MKSCACIVVGVLLALARYSVQAEVKWSYDSSAGTLTEVLPAESANTPWIFPYSAAGVIGKYSQKGTSTIIDLRAAAMPSGAPALTQVGNGGFIGGTAVQEVYLPEDTVTKINSSAFSACSSLRKIEPLIPNSVTKIGPQDVFRSCTALQGTLTIGGGDGPMKDLSEDKRYMFCNMSSISAIVFGAGVNQTYFNFSMGGNWNNHGGYAGMSSVTSIVCRAKRTLYWTQSLEWPEGIRTCLFQDMTKLRHVEVYGWLSKASALPARTSGKCRLVVPHGNAAWRDFATNVSGTNLKLWETMTAVEQKAYWDEFYPGDMDAAMREASPSGLSLAGNAISMPAGYWIVRKHSPVQKWTYNATAQTLTEVVAAGKTPWIFPYSAAGVIGKRSQIGTSSVLDFRTTSMPTNAPAMTQLGTSFLDSCSSVLELYLPKDTITKINSSAFAGCTSLAKIEPLMPDSVTYVGQQSVFRSCNALCGTLTFAGDGRAMSALSGDKRYMFQSMSSITELVYGEGIDNSYFIFSDGNYWVSHGGMAGMSAVTSITCRTTATMSWRQGVESPEGIRTCLFNDMTKLQCVNVNGFISSGKGLPSTTAGQTRMFVPAQNSDWQGFYNNVSTPTNVTPWASLSSADQQAYWDKFYPGDAEAPTREFVPAGKTLKGNAISMPGGYWIVPKTRCALMIDLSFGCTNGVVSCELSPAPVNGAYAPGTSVTISLSPESGVTFAGWKGPIPAADKTKTTITVAMDASKTLKASFRTEFWSYDPVSATLTDGDWTFRVTGTRTALTIAETLSAGVSAELDFTRPIYGGGAVIAVGQNAFECTRRLERILLPESVGAVGGWAFAGADRLSVAFAGDCPELCAWAFPTGGVARIVADRGNASGWRHFARATEGLRKWDDLSASEQASYWTLFPKVSGDRRVPFGILADGVWFVPARMDGMTLRLR